MGGLCCKTKENSNEKEAQFISQDRTAPGIVVVWENKDINSL